MAIVCSPPKKMQGKQIFKTPTSRVNISEEWHKQFRSHMLHHKLDTMSSYPEGQTCPFSYISLETRILGTPERRCQPVREVWTQSHCCRTSYLFAKWALVLSMISLILIHWVSLMSFFVMHHAIWSPSTLHSGFSFDFQAVHLQPNSSLQPSHWCSFRYSPQCRSNSDAYLPTRKKYNVAKKRWRSCDGKESLFHLGITETKENLDGVGVHLSLWSEKEFWWWCRIIVL